MHAPNWRQPSSPPSASRRLHVESLEDRRLLSASPAGNPLDADADQSTPWQNPVHRFDVNNDSRTTSIDVVTVINRILSDGAGALPDPGPNPVQFFVDTSGDNRLSPFDVLGVVNALLTAPSVSISPLPAYTSDVTPRLTVTARGPSLPDGTPIALDVDVNGDGDFSDPGELGHTQSALYDGQSSFDVAPALTPSAVPYTVNFRARVRNAEAVQGSSPLARLQIDTTSSSVLAGYVNIPDPAYGYQLAAGAGVTNPIPGATATGSYWYWVLDMTSQTWRSASEVDAPRWEHWIEVYVPVAASGEVIADLDETAVLFIGGGAATDLPPQTPNPALALTATTTRSVVANLSNVPNQPLVFADELSRRSGDEILAYTFDKFMQNLGQPDNETWPVLLPMVKSAARAMDAVQDFVPTLDAAARIVDFAVTGYGNRGWTTWLTAAVDDRVSAIIPGVFEYLNLPAQMAHHYAGYGFFSEALADYDALNVYQRIMTDGGAELARIVDPLQYRFGGVFDDLPKLLINSPGDEFFATDSAQFYFHDLPGDQNYLRYIPNTNHALERAEDKAADSSLAFLDAVLNDRPLPEFSWTVDPDQTIRVQTVTAPSKVVLWQMNNPDTRDFRRMRFPRRFWFSRELVDSGGGNYVTDVEMPASGARAYFVELTFPNPVPGLPDHVFTTEVRVKTTLPLTPWPFDSQPAGSAANLLAPSAPPTGESPTGPSARSNAARNAIATALAAPPEPPQNAPQDALIDTPQATADESLVDLIAHARASIAPASPELAEPLAEADGESTRDERDAAFAEPYELARRDS